MAKLTKSTSSVKVTFGKKKSGKIKKKYGPKDGETKKVQRSGSLI